MFVYRMSMVFSIRHASLTPKLVPSFVTMMDQLRFFLPKKPSHIRESFIRHAM